MEPRHQKTARDIRRANRSILLTRLYFDPPQSRLELARTTGLSSATVSNLTGEFVDEGLVVTAGQVESDGGRPRVLLKVAAEYGYFVGVDVGETGVKAELFDLAMTRLAELSRPSASPRPLPGDVADAVAAACATLLAQAALQPDQLIGVGIAVPGTVEHTGDQIVHAPTIGWSAVPLGKLLHERGLTAPLFIANGAKAQSLAEMWFGAGRGSRDAVVALVGSGVGAAVITGGTTYGGVSGSAGEWGHTPLVFDGRACRCGSRGCLEAYIGAEGLLELYAERAGGTPNPDETAGFDELLAAATTSADAAAVLETAAAHLGAGIGGLINLLNPERVVLGGWTGVALGERYLEQIRASAARHSLAHIFERTDIALAEHGPDAIAFGAATLALEALLVRGTDPRRVG